MSLNSKRVHQFSSVCSGHRGKKNPRFSVSQISRESGFCLMIIALDSWDIVCWEIAFLLNEATDFYSMGQLLFNKTFGHMVRCNEFCPETIHVPYSNRNNDKHYPAVLMPVAVQSKARDCGRSLAGIPGSNSTGGWMDVFLVWVLCVVRWRPLWRTDRSSRGDVPLMVCLNECDRGTSQRRPRTAGAVELWGKNYPVVGEHCACLSNGP